MTHTPWISTRIASVAAVLAGVGFPAPAAAKDGHQIGVYGQVAPRCWVADPGRTIMDAAPASSRGRAICNQTQPLLITELRAISADGALAERVSISAEPSIVPASLPSRSALAIVVSPQI